MSRMFQSYYIALALASLCIAQSLSRADAANRARDLSALGRKMFFDSSLSASGKQSCASCHDPKFAYGPPGDAIERRAVPSLRYLQGVPQFTEHYFDAEATGEDSADNGPTGGLTWDGRADRGRDQARTPLLVEMGNESPDRVVRKALRASYAAELNRLARGRIFDTILEAIEAFEQDEKEFYPYSSKYDAYLAGKAKLTDRELLGLQLFADPKKGDCARCHPADRGATGTPPQFTDYAFVALGVPRNPAVPSDLGLCSRPEFKDRDEYCGRFRTPSLRNVATRKVFFHNGSVHSLREAVEFYVKRKDTFDDLPPKFWKNIEPLSTSKDLSDSEIDAIVDFLRTLTDAIL